MNPIYTAAIIGAGNIAANYDEPGNPLVLTHAHAITSCDRLRCIGFYDVDSERAREASRKWGTGMFSSLEELLSREVDLLVVCVPDAVHSAVLYALVDYPVRLVLCEKPLTTSYPTSLAVVEIYRQRNIALAVNYQRRYDPVVCQLKSAVLRGDLGEFVAGSVLYSKGILHNGSHAVDLLRYIFGEARGLIATARVHDHSNSDPTVTGTLFLEAGPIQFVAGDERHFSLFEIDLVFQKGRHRFLQSGLVVERYEVRADAVFAGYRELISIGTERSGLGQALKFMMEDLVSYLDGEFELRIAAANTLRTQYVCEQFATAPLYTFTRLD